MANAHQGDALADTRLAQAQVDVTGEVAGGCYCCRFEDFAATITRLVDEDGVDTVLAEAVGSCTDLQATVIRPLRSRYAAAAAGRATPDRRPAGPARVVRGPRGDRGAGRLAYLSTASLPGPT